METRPGKVVSSKDAACVNLDSARTGFGGVTGGEVAGAASTRLSAAVVTLKTESSLCGAACDGLGAAGGGGTTGTSGVTTAGGPFGVGVAELPVAVEAGVPGCSVAIIAVLICNMVGFDHGIGKVNPDIGDRRSIASKR